MGKRWSRLLALLLVCCFALAQPAAGAVDEGTDVTIGTGVAEKPTAEVRVKWKDSWFAAGADEYQHELAEAAMALSAAAYVRTAQGRSVQKALEAFGFDHVKSYNYQFSAQSSSRTAYTFAAKSVKDKDGGTVKLVAIVIRGTGVYTEWAGNLNVGSGSEHEGFAQARDELMGNLEKYLPEAGVTGKVKFLVTGHSRGAAPAVSTEAKAEGYENIFNLVCGDDLVPQVPLAQWGYGRYGIDRYLPAKDAGEEDYDRQFAAMNQRYLDLTGQSYAVYQDRETVEKLTGTLYQLAPAVSGPNMAMLSALLRGDLEELSALVEGNPVAALLMGRTAIRASSELTPLLQREQAALVSAHCMAGYYSWLAACPEI